MFEDQDVCQAVHNLSIKGLSTCRILKTVHFCCRNAKISLFCLKNSIYVIFEQSQEAPTRSQGLEVPVLNMLNLERMFHVQGYFYFSCFVKSVHRSPGGKRKQCTYPGSTSCTLSCSTLQLWYIQNDDYWEGAMMMILITNTMMRIIWTSQGPFETLWS